MTPSYSSLPYKRQSMLPIRTDSRTRLRGNDQKRGSAQPLPFSTFKSGARATGSEPAA